MQSYMHPLLLLYYELSDQNSRARCLSHPDLECNAPMPEVQVYIREQSSWSRIFLEEEIEKWKRQKKRWEDVRNEATFARAKFNQRRDEERNSHLLTLANKTRTEYAILTSMRLKRKASDSLFLSRAYSSTNAWIKSLEHLESIWIPLCRNVEI